jgi:putative nucleotidyltransferase with HDIG domain
MGKIDISCFKKLVEIERSLCKAKSCEELLKKITRTAKSLLDVDIASIFSLNSMEMCLIGETGSGIEEKKIKDIRVPLSFSKTALDAYKKKKAVSVVDVRKEGKIPKEFVEKYDFRSSLTVPLIGMKNEVLGFLFLDIMERTKEFSDEERILAESFAHLAALALEQTRLRDELKNRIDILSAYDEIIASSIHPVTKKKVLKRILQKTMKVFKMDGGVIQTIEGDELVFKVFVGATKKQVAPLVRIPSGSVIPGEKAEYKKIVVVEDIEKDERYSPDILKIVAAIGYRSFISLPLLAEDKIVGFLRLASKQKKVFKREEIENFSRIGKQIGAVLENMNLFENMSIAQTKIKALIELNQSIVSILDLSTLFSCVLNELPSIIPCCCSSIMLLDDTRKELQVVSASEYGPKKRTREKVRIPIGEGITGKVVETGKPVIVNDVGKQEEYIRMVKKVKSEIVVPLYIKGRIDGVLNIESEKINIYSNEDLGILSAFANQLSIAIENATLYQESRERAEQLELINKVIKEIGYTQDMKELSTKLCNAIQGHFFYDHALLFLIEEDEKSFELMGYAGTPRKISDFHQRVDQGLMGVCVQKRKSLLVNHTKKERGFISHYPFDVETNSELDIPLITNDKVIGVLCLQSRTEEAFTEWDRVAMETISEHIVTLINNAQLYTDLKLRMTELSNVYEIGVDLSTSRDIDELLEKMYRRTCSMTGATTFYIALYDEESNTVKFELDYEEGRRRPQETYPLGEVGGYTGWILESNLPMLIKDFKKDSTRYPVKPIFDGLKMKSYLGIPIRFKDEVIGVMSLQSREPNAFNEETMNLFTTFANQLGVVIENARLFTEMDVVMGKLEHSYDETLRSLVSALDFRESETQYHSVRVAIYAVELAKRINIPEDELPFIYWGGMLHDIGKIGVPDEILLKPSSLTQSEWKEIKKHPKIGYEIVKDIKFLKNASNVILYHHEWWNGEGYPFGRSKEKIPQCARIFSVADALDSMTSKRPYRDQISFKEAFKEIHRFSGRQFDPEVVEAFSSVPIKLWERIKKSRPLILKFKIPTLKKKYS